MLCQVKDVRHRMINTTWSHPSAESTEVDLREVERIWLPEVEEEMRGGWSMSPKLQFDGRNKFYFSMGQYVEHRSS